MGREDLSRRMAIFMRASGSTVPSKKEPREVLMVRSTEALSTIESATVSVNSRWTGDLYSGERGSWELKKKRRHSKTRVPSINLRIRSSMLATRTKMGKMGNSEWTTIRKWLRLKSLKDKEIWITSSWTIAEQWKTRSINMITRSKKWKIALILLSCCLTSTQMSFRSRILGQMCCNSIKKNIKTSRSDTSRSTWMTDGHCRHFQRNYMSTQLTVSSTTTLSRRSWWTTSNSNVVSRSQRTERLSSCKTKRWLQFQGTNSSRLRVTSSTRGSKEKNPLQRVKNSRKQSTRKSLLITHRAQPAVSTISRAL